MEEMIGKVVGSYVVTQFIGEGGMGTVWVGKHQTIDRQVAIKVLHPQYARNEKVRDRFRKEAGTLARLQHPNIVSLYDYIESPSQLCLVMEYVDGIDLDVMIRKHTGPLPHEKLSGIFKQMVDAISYAHKNNVVHRDIKPSNFMLTKDGTVKVLDFGIAKLLDDDQQLTRTGMRMGTTAFMSPEQVDAKPVDHRTDIYSLGVTLFVLATGVSPYEGNTSEFQVYNKIVNEPLPKASSIYPGTSPLVDRLIAKATAKRVEDRFQKCEEFGSLSAFEGSDSDRATNDAFSRAGESEEFPARQGNNNDQPSYEPTRLRWLSWVIADCSAIFLLIIGMLIFWAVNRFQKWDFYEFELNFQPIRIYSWVITGYFLSTLSIIGGTLGLIVRRKNRKRWLLAVANTITVCVIGIVSLFAAIKIRVDDSFMFDYFERDMTNFYLFSFFILFFAVIVVVGGRR